MSGLPAREPGPLAAPLAGRTALVTGASRGIGLAAVRALAGAGATVVAVARDPRPLAALAESSGVHSEACDVSVPSAVEALAERVTRRLDGPPDVLVSSAGRFELSPVQTTSVDDFAATLATNLVGPFALARAFLPAMHVRGSGHIVTVGSVADRVAFPENGAYAASKFGLRGLHEVLRAELRGSGVRTTLVSPGPTDTALWDPIDPDARPGFAPRAAMLLPEDVADAILFAVTRPTRANVDELRLSRA